MNNHLSKIGPAEREQHFYLKPDHHCYYWGEYTPWMYTQGRNAEFSEVNTFVADLKMPLELRGTPQWDRKQAAIDSAGLAFARFWRWRELADKCVLVAVPASRSHDDLLYDDRVEQILNRIQYHAGVPLTCLRLLESDGTLQASHSSEQRPKPAQLVRSIQINQVPTPAVAPKWVYLFDDVLTSGAHFVACSTHIRKLFPNTKIIGNFVARSRRPEADE